MDKYYNDEEMANLMGITVNRLRNKIHYEDPLPPRIETPGCRKRLWPVDGVHAWLENYIVRYDKEKYAQKVSTHKPRRIS